MEPPGDTDWETIWRQLLAYVVWRAGHYRWQRGGQIELAAGEMVEDIVQEVLVRTLSGTRCWDPTRGPLLPWLQDQARSIIDALARSAAHRRGVRIPDGVESDDDPMKCTAADPLEILLRKEAQTWAQAQINALRGTVAEDPEIAELLDVMLVGSECRPRYLAATLGVPPADIYNRLKRLRRCAVRLFGTYSGKKKVLDITCSL